MNPDEPYYQLSRAVFDMTGAQNTAASEVATGTVQSKPKVAEAPEDTTNIFASRKDVPFTKGAKAIAETVEFFGDRYPVAKETPVTKASPLLPIIRFTERFEEVWEQNVLTPKKELTPDQKIRMSLLITSLYASTLGAGVGIAFVAQDIFAGTAFAIMWLFLGTIWTINFEGHLLDRNALPKPNEAARRYREKHAAHIEQLTKDIAAFEEGLPYLDVLRGTSGRYEECLERCKQRHARLSTEANELIEGLRNANAVEAAYARLEELKRRMPQLIDGADVDRITQDLTPFIAMVEAQECIDDRRLGNVLDTSLAITESSEEEEDRFHE